MRILLTLLFALTFSAGLYAQPLVQVTDINDATPAMLANCNDSSSYVNDTVTVVCYVVTPGNLSEVLSSSINGANGIRPFIWVNDTANGGAVGPNTGLEVMGVNWNTSQATTGFVALQQGDLVELTGVVGTYNNATQFQPLDNNAITLVNRAPKTFTPAQITVGDLNDQNQVNNLVTGEKWEGAFVEFHDLTVTSVNQFGSGVGARVEFTVADAAGNSMQVYDFFLAQKLGSWPASNPNSPASFGSFSAPSVGTVLDTLRGVIEHSGNGCTGGTGQGYRVHPFDSTHYVLGKALPGISNVAVTPSVPSSSDPIMVEADVVDPDGSVDSVNIFWSANPNDPISAFNKNAMTLSAGVTYSYTIPAQANNTVVRYYIQATDNDTGTSSFPVTASGVPTNTASIYVRDGGLSIADVQTPAGGDDASPFEGQEITIRGYVTAASRECDLGYVYIQDSANTEYAGIALSGSLDLAGLYRNQKVEVTGTITESFGFTQMSVTSVNSLGMSYQVEPVELDPSNASLDMEKYESMLVTFKAPNSGDPLYITNADLGFGEYAIASVQSPADPTEYKRVLAGRSAGTNAQSSLYVQLVSDSSYATTDGSMFYTPIETNTNMSMDAMTGIVWYSFSNFKLLPRNNNDIEGLSVTLDTAGCNVPYFSLSELSTTEKLNLYPNPTSGNVTLNGFTKDVEVQIFDLKGTLVKSVSAEANTELNIDMNSAVDGLYLIRVSANDGTAYGTYKLIIAH